MNIAADGSHVPGTRERILVEADRLFRHFGYSKTNVSDIARELGMSPANIYRFFPSKSAICEAVAQNMLDSRIAESRAVAAGPGTVSERIRAILVNEHRLTVETLIDDKRVHEMVVIAMNEQWHVIEKFLQDTRQIYVELILEGIANGEFPPQDAAFSARCLHQAFAMQCHPMLVVECLQDNEKATADDMADFVLRALRSAPVTAVGATFPVSKRGAQTNA